MSESVIRLADDPASVASQYATECGLAARKSVYADVSGPDAREIALGRLPSASQRRCSRSVVARGRWLNRLPPGSASSLSSSTCRREWWSSRAAVVSTRVADVQSLPFADDTFDVVLAAWMLYHVPDLDRGLGEIARVLRPGGALVAVTNAPDHLHETWELAGIRWEFPFDADEAQSLLRRYFPSVERREAYGAVVFADIASVRAYYGSSA